MPIESTSHPVASMGRVLGHVRWAGCLMGREVRQEPPKDLDDRPIRPVLDSWLVLNFHAVTVRSEAENDPVLCILITAALIVPP
jgi:hypothetical protein